MAQADSANSTNPSGITLTRKGERYARTHARPALALVDLRLPVLQSIARSVERLEQRLIQYGGASEGSNFRSAAEHLVEELITVLDEMAGDPELEPEQELEILPDGTVLEFDDSDLEPSIGRPEMMDQAKAWKLHPGEPSGLGSADLEHDDMDREGDDLDRLECGAEDYGEDDELSRAEGVDAPTDPDYARRLRQRRSSAPLDNTGPLHPTVPMLHDPETGEPYLPFRVDVTPTDFVRSLR